jgi:uncharacterized FlaG/YvyC family protein
MNAPTTGDDAAAQETVWLTRQVVAAIHRLNRPELLDRGRELKLRKRASGQRPMVDVVDPETGEVLDQLPPEAVLRMMDELEKDREGDV